MVTKALLFHCLCLSLLWHSIAFAYCCVCIPLRRSLSGTARFLLPLYMHTSAISSFQQLTPQQRIGTSPSDQERTILGEESELVPCHDDLYVVGGGGSLQVNNPTCPASVGLDCTGYSGCSCLYITHAQDIFPVGE